MALILSMQFKSSMVTNLHRQIRTKKQRPLPNDGFHRRRGDDRCRMNVSRRQEEDHYHSLGKQK